MHQTPDSQRALLAHLRHELRTPINGIIGYSEMLLEDLQADKKSVLFHPLKLIQTYGKELAFQVGRILSSDEMESIPSALDIQHLNQIVRLEMTDLVREVIALCDKLLQWELTESQSDIAKIQEAARSLMDTIDKGMQFAAQSFPAVDPQTSSIPSFPKARLNCPIAEGTILVVDDNQINRDLLSTQIQQQGYGVTTVADGLQAIEAISTGDYDLILLDIIMPEMNGYQVLQWLKESPWRHIPVVAISALDEIDSAVKCIEMGAQDYLPKPFNPVLLRARIGACLEKKRLRDREVRYLEELANANQEITLLNDCLKAENLRLSAELEITRRLQQMILPQDAELDRINGIEIAGFMEPAEEVGGDYYDVLHHNGRVKIGIGDVTGHGLESGVLTIMAQTAVRTLMEHNETDSKKFLEVLNRTIYKNARRMNSDRNMTLSLVDYQDGKVNFSGQHEEVIIVRSGGIVERIDTVDLGFPLGLEESIEAFVAQTSTQLNPGDAIVLYTDGITDAENELGEHYGLERLCDIVRQNWQYSAREIRQRAIADLRRHIGNQKLYDDITLVVLKQK